MIGKNVDLKDKLIKKTESKNKVSKVSITNNINIKNKIGQPSNDPKTTTYKTKKMTFYIKDDLLKRLYSFAYWDRHSITESINIILTDGLKNKITKETKK